MNFYLGEDFTVEFSAGIDLTGGTAVIKYKRPSGPVKSNTATITDAANGVFNYAVPDTELTETGPHLFWSVITLASGAISISAPRTINILEEGTKQ